MRFVHLEQYWRRPEQREKETDRVGLGERVGGRERDKQRRAGGETDRQMSNVLKLDV